MAGVLLSVTLIRIVIPLVATCEGVSQNTTLAMRIAHGSLREFDPKKESVEDFHERF